MYNNNNYGKGLIETSRISYRTVTWRLQLQLEWLNGKKKLVLSCHIIICKVGSPQNSYINSDK